MRISEKLGGESSGIQHEEPALSENNGNCFCVDVKLSSNGKLTNKQKI